MSEDRYERLFLAQKVETQRLIDENGQLRERIALLERLIQQAADAATDTHRIR